MRRPIAYIFIFVMFLSLLFPIVLHAADGIGEQPLIEEPLSVLACTTKIGSPRTDRPRSPQLDPPI